MSVQIINRTKRLAIVPLNSGESIHLAPGEKSPPIDEFELENNAKVEKLLNLMYSAGNLETKVKVSR